MRRHCKIGEEILTHNPKGIKLITTLTGSEIGNFEHVLNPLEKMSSTIAMAHHEKWDGSGYPNGLAGENIHIYGRITAIADVFDALGHDRVYKKAWPLKNILELFEEGKGKHFDPDLIELFIDNLDDFLTVKKKFDGEDNMKESK